VRLYQLKDTARMMQCLVYLGVAVVADLIGPARVVIVALLLVEAGEEAIQETKPRLHEE
jgi:hypothetical protein